MATITGILHFTGAARGYGAAGHGREQAARTHPSVSDRRSSVVAVKGHVPARSHLECEIPLPDSRLGIPLGLT